MLTEETASAANRLHAGIEWIEDFAYRPLDISRGDIRLLAFTDLDATISHDIRCSLQHVPLELHETNNGVSELRSDQKKSAEYVALSYAWGEPSVSDFIWLDGHKFSVRRNLYDSLRQLRTLLINEGLKEGRMPYIWVSTYFR